MVIKAIQRSRWICRQRERLNIEGITRQGHHICPSRFSMYSAKVLDVKPCPRSGVFEPWLIFSKRGKPPMCWTQHLQDLQGDVEICAAGIKKWQFSDENVRHLTETYSLQDRFESTGSGKRPIPRRWENATRTPVEHMEGHIFSAGHLKFDDQPQFVATVLCQNPNLRVDGIVLSRPAGDGGGRDDAYAHIFDSSGHVIAREAIAKNMCRLSIDVMARKNM